MFKSATPHDEARTKRAGGYAVDFINLQPQEKIIVTTKTSERAGEREGGRERRREGEKRRGSMTKGPRGGRAGRGKGRGKSWHARAQ